MEEFQFAHTAEFHYDWKIGRKHGVEYWILLVGLESPLVLLMHWTLQVVRHMTQECAA